MTAAVGDEKLKLSEASRLCGIGVRILKLLACLLPAFAAHPLESAEVLGPHAGEPVVFEDVADVVFAKYVGPDVVRTDLTGDHLTGIQPNPQLQLHAVAVFDLNRQPRGLGLNLQRRQAGTKSVVLQRHRRTEHRHDPVAAEEAI